ncbi:MAG: fused MFS/spermidine synthase [Candidatus Sumerlaeia bacterium]|nr:fused MFS/spermidine synthase [Candidatus Sumerlaeia bacterium]
MAISSTAPASAQRPTPPRAPLVLLLFVSSGFAGLVYEVLWSRMLTYVFGATLYAVSTVLAAFMGGLALGSFLFGRWVDRRRNPLRIYALLELGIAAGALAVPFLLRWVHPIYAGFYRDGEPSFRTITLVRLALTIAVLLVPTTLMGATLPVLSKWYARVGDRLGLSLGVLYAINTFGAVLGCYTAGFHGIAVLGVTGMMYVAVGINAAVGLLAWVLSALPGAEVEPAPAASPAADRPVADDGWPTDVTPQTAQMVFWFYGISGAVALAYQVAWSRSLIFSFELLKNTTYAFTAMLAVFLTGLAAGSALMTRFVDRLPEPVRCFSLLQLGIGLMGAFSLVAVRGIIPDLAPFREMNEDQTQIYFAAAVANIFVKTAVAILPATLLMGMAYPVAARICVPSLQRVGRTVGDLYSINTVGAILGSLAAGFILIPTLRIPWTLFLLSMGNIAMAVALTLNLPHLHPTRRYFVIGLAGLCALVLLVRFPFDTVFHRPEATQRLVYYEEGPLATVSVMENPMGERTLYVDKVGVAGTDRILVTDQKSLAHIPMLIHEKPQTALTVGFGSGGASYSYLQYASLEKLDCVEICPTVLNAAFLLTTANKGKVLNFTRRGAWSPADPRYSVILDDVRSFLRFTPKRYDVIATDCTDLRYKTNANLYDLEYFQLCRDRLTSAGMVVVWMPLSGLSPEMFRCALRTFHKVFPDFSIWYMNNEPTHYILLVGSAQPLHIDYRRMVERLKEPAVGTDLRELLLDSADKLLSCYLTDGRALAADLENAPINSENRPYLEFYSPLYGYSEQPLFDNLDYLISKAGKIETYLKAGSYGPDDLARIHKYLAAVPEILKGHKHYRLNEVGQATRAYMRAQELCPEDRAIARLLNFELLQARAAALPNDLWSRYELGQALLIQKRYDEAISYLEQCIGIGQSLRGRPVAQEQVALVHKAAEALRELYKQQNKPQAVQKLDTRMKDVPTTGTL